MSKGLKNRQEKSPFSRIAIFLLSPWTVGVAGCLGMAAYSVVIGQTVNWDLLNYHYYNGFAVFAGRPGRDILAAQMQTFLNPALFMPFYLGTTLMRPLTLGAVTGLVQGLNIVLVYILARRLLSCPPAGAAGYVSCSLTSLGIAAAGATAPLFLCEAGTFFGDSLTAVPVLAGMALIFYRPQKQTWYVVLLGGLLMGAATGFKLTNGIFVLAAIVCAWWYSRSLKNSLVNVACFSLGSGLGFLLVHGWWSWYLFQEYQAPLFPYFNSVFNSPYYAPVNFRDARFLPHSFLDALSYPFQWAAGLYPSSELPFRDFRFAIISILLVPAVIMVCIRSIRERAPALAPDKFNLLLFFLSGYVIWIAVFGIQRYLVVLELLSGLVIFLLLELLVKSARYRAYIFVPLALLAIVTTVPANYGRVSWGPSWFDTRVPPALQAQNEMFVMLSTEPYSYLVPSFPADSRFVRIESNLDPAKTKFDVLIRRAINGHTGPIYAVSVGALDERQVKLLAGYGLYRQDTNSIPVSSKAHPDIQVFRLLRN